MDLNDLESVKTFVDYFEALVPHPSRLDILINNAGIMAIPERSSTKQG